MKSLGKRLPTVTDGPHAGQLDINALLPNLVDRHREGLYDRVRLPEGVATPRVISCFQDGIGSTSGGKCRDWADTNLYGNGQLNAPYDAIVSRFLMVFQPQGSRSDEHVFLWNYIWEFSMLQKVLQRHSLLEFSVKGNIRDVIRDFGTEECKGKLERFAVPYAYNLCDLSRYIPPLVSFKVALVGEPFVPQQPMDFYSILDGTVDWPVQ